MNIRAALSPVAPRTTSSTPVAASVAPRVAVETPAQNTVERASLSVIQEGSHPGLTLPSEALPDSQAMIRARAEAAGYQSVRFAWGDLCALDHWTQLGAEGHRMDESSCGSAVLVAGLALQGGEATHGALRRLRAYAGTVLGIMDRVATNQPLTQRVSLQRLQIAVRDIERLQALESSQWTYGDLHALRRALHVVARIDEATRSQPTSEPIDLRVGLSYGTASFFRQLLWHSRSVEWNGVQLDIARVEPQADLTWHFVLAEDTHQSAHTEVFYNPWPTVDGTAEIIGDRGEGTIGRLSGIEEETGVTHGYDYDVLLPGAEGHAPMFVHPRGLDWLK